LLGGADGIDGEEVEGEQRDTWRWDDSGEVGLKTGVLGIGHGLDKKKEGQ
jgi:hypothetical protein